MSTRPSGRGPHVLVLADGGRPTRAGLDAAWPGWADGVATVVAADGGAHLAADLGVKIDLWVRDGDSLGQVDLDRLRAAGVPIELAREDKDESDAELALLAAPCGLTPHTSAPCSRIVSSLSRNSHASTVQPGVSSAG